MPGDIAVSYHVCVLGPLSVEGPDGELDPGGGKPRLLLSMLVAAAGSVVSTERLIDGLWGEDPPPTARKTVQVHVSNLRRSLGVGFPLLTTRTGYRIDADQVAIDAVLFEAELTRATAIRSTSPAEAADVLAAALQLWTGPAYADIADEDAIRPEAVRLTELRLRAVEQRIEADLRMGRHDAVLGELETLSTDYPFRERLRELQMLALYRCGRQADALRVYERTRVTLADELGLDPGPGLRQLHQQILDQSNELDLVLAAPAIVAAAAAGDRVIERTLRGYELRERLGDGGTRDGTVFRAYQASLGREVALRVIPPAESNQPAFVKRFEASCQMLAELAHPHIVSLYDYWRDPDGAYLAMPLLRGGTLARSLDRSLWRPPAALRLIDQIGSALGYAHRHGVVHGDVRASSVLLDEDANGYLCDFAIDSDFARHSDAAGASGIAADIDRLAVLTCELLTGAGPADARFTRVDLPPGFDELIERATDSKLDRRFERVEDYLRALRQCFGADVVSTGGGRATSDARNPFKGLRAFREADAMDFFGRDELLTELIEQVQHHGLTAVVGPSGSGKSSLVRAGLIPACRRGGLELGRDIVVAEMFPGAYPFEELEAALMRVAVDRPSGVLAELNADDRGLLRVAKQILPDDDTDLLLIVDQFEELFALTADETVRQTFLANLAAVGSERRRRVRVVVTLRADFFDRPLEYPEFGELLRTSMTTLALPGDSNLAEAISEPARRVGLEIEPGLIPTILRDVANQPGALPMLQYALTELADRRRGNLLTIEAYRASGGVVGALAARAEEIYSSLTITGRDAAREMFVRLVSVSDGSEDTRRRVRRTELEGLGIDPRTLATVIDAFGSFRLLSFDHDPITRGPTVEVAHEALIREWPRFRQWVDERRDDLRAERRLESAVSEWVLADRDPQFLISGLRLERYEQWINSSPVRLTADERDFIEASRVDARRRLESGARRRRRVVVGALTLAVVALVAAGVALVQRDRANSAADEAARQSRAATAAAATADRLRADTQQAAMLDRAQAAMASVATQRDPDLRLSVALAEHDALQSSGLSDPSVTSTLYQAVVDDRIVARIPVDSSTVIGRERSEVGVVANHDGSMFIMGLLAGGWVSVVDTASGTLKSTREWPRIAGSNWDDRGEVMTGLYDGTVQFWLPTGELIRSVSVSSRGVEPLLLRNGQLAFAENTAPTDGRFTLVVKDLDSGREVFRSPSLGHTWSISPSGRYVAIFERRLAVRVFDTATWTDVTPDGFASGFADATRLNMSWAEDEQLWVADYKRVARFDVTTGEQTASIDAGLARINFVSESRDGHLLAVGGYRTPIRVFDTSSGQLVDEVVAANRDGPGDVFSSSSVTWASGRRLVVAQGDSTLIWNLAEPTAAESFWPRTEITPILSEITPSDDRILGSADGDVDIFDDSGQLRTTIRVDSEPDVPPVVSADGRILAVANESGVQFVDVATGDIRGVAPSGLTRPLALSHDGRIATVGTGRHPDDQQHRVALVDTTSGRQLVNVGGLIDGERGAFTADGRLAVIPISNVPRSYEPVRSGIDVIDTATGRVLGVGRGQDCVRAIEISHDDRTVASLGCAGDIALFDLALLGSPRSSTALIGGNTDDLTPAVGIAFTPDDATVIVTREDGRVEAYRADAGFERLWSFDVGEHAGAPDVRDGMVWVGVTPDVAAGTTSGGMVAMPLDSDALVSLARATLTRTMTASECTTMLGADAC